MNLKKINSLFDTDGTLSNRGVRQLQKWGIIRYEGYYKCRNGHPFKLRSINSSDAYEWRCRSKVLLAKKKSRVCQQRFSIRSFTIFENSHLSIYKIIIFIYQWLKNNMLYNIGRDLNISSKSAYMWNKKCYNMCVRIIKRGFQIGGPHKVVEIDLFRISKRKYYRGHVIGGQWVFGGVERDTRKCFIVCVENRSLETLLPLIKKFIINGTTIISDCWRAYHSLNKEGYTHYTTNSEELCKDPLMDIHIETIECLWQHIKKSMPLYSRRKDYFEGYLAKYMFRRWCHAERKNYLKQFLKNVHNFDIDEY